MKPILITSLALALPANASARLTAMVRVITFNFTFIVVSVVIGTDTASERSPAEETITCTETNVQCPIANSSASLAIAKIAAEKKRVFLSPGSGTTRLTNEECNPYTVQYTYDTMSVARGTGTAMVKQGHKSWYFLTADVAFGNSLEKDTGETVKANGGTVVGAVKHPLSASDFSSFLLQAQSRDSSVRSQ